MGPMSEQSKFRQLVDEAKRAKRDEEAIKDKRRALGKKLRAAAGSGLLTDAQRKDALKYARGTAPKRRRSSN